MSAKQSAVRVLRADSISPRMSRGAGGVLFVCAAIASLSGCNSRGNLPKPASPEYAQTVSDFYTGLAALQVGDDVHAESKLAEVTKLAPDEPAGWADWGVLAFRQRNFDVASQRYERARSLDGKNDQIFDLLGVLESARGNSQQAIVDWRKSTEINPQNYRAAYLLAQEVEREGGDQNDLEYQSLIQGILKARPNNLAASLELARIAAKRGDSAAFQSAMAQIAPRASTWPPEVQQQLTALQTAAAGPDIRAAAVRTTFLRNSLMRVPEFRESLATLQAAPGEEAEPLTRFLRLEAPTFAPAPADTALTLAPQPLPNEDKTRWNWVGAIPLGSTGAPVVAEANAHEVRLASGAKFPFPGGRSNTPPSAEGVVPLDFNYDFKTDLVLAGPGGVRLMRQDDPAKFTDVTAKAKLPKSITESSYTGAWAIDIDADGDLDIVLGAKDGLPLVLRNNGDDTFTPIHPFAGVSGLVAFAWADIDGDGNPDAALVDAAGQLHVFHNQRQTQFRELQLPAGFSHVKALNVADVDDDGVLDLLAVEADGAIVRISDKHEGQPLDVAEIARVPDAASELAAEVRLHVADLDNNGAVDLILAPASIGSAQTAAGKPAQTLVWLGDVSAKDHDGKFVRLDHPFGQAAPPAVVSDPADLSSNGHLDLLCLSADGQPLQAVNRSIKNYHWQIVRPHAKQAVGDQRINPFGVGGEMEIRAGMLVQKEPITGPQIHFGLGNQTSADVVRVVWPNGTVRAEFGVPGDTEVVTEQRLKASCPFLFAYNGKGMEFIKDAVPWGSAIGLRINTIGTARVETTKEEYKISRDQLVPHDGYYDLRVTAELWEVYYYDYLALLAVDHPVGTEIFVDERFSIPPPKLDITTTATPHDIARALDDNGNDVTDLVRALDGKAVDSFGRGQYQGITRDHYLEVDLGDDAPKTGPLYLIGYASIHDTESSLNVAITQGHRWRAQGMSLEVPDGRGGWVTAQSNLGFPAGRKKTVLFNLTNVFRPGTSRKVRIRTNLEIYWDCIQWAEGAPNAPVKTTRLGANYADLHYRGYSSISRPDSGAPEIPDYDNVVSTKQRWRDLIGYYTRYGDVRELLTNVDDRYVIVASGDELSLRFPEQPAPPAGWLRDYVLVGDGWIKDGDFNSTFSKTVLPLPYHAKNQYDTPPGTLEDEYVYRLHPEDWQNYHTRYITPDVFQNNLRSEPPQ